MTEPHVPVDSLRRTLRESVNLSGIATSGRSAHMLTDMVMPAVQRLVADTVERQQQEALWEQGDAWIRECGKMNLPPEKRLTRAEYLVLRLTAQGLSIAAIGEALNMPPDTVRDRRRSIYVKWGTNIPVRIVVFAIHTGLLDTSDLLGVETLGST